MTREQAKEKIKELVERFREHKAEYHTPDYNETKTRIGLINPFFHALGWDVSHEEDRIESYREVIHEDKVKVKGQMKAPDYGFRVAGQGDKRLFFVEAKKPSVSLKTNREASYQLRIYGRSAQAPVSILTNFEEFIIYDCTKSPRQNDSASSARIKYIHFEDYIKEFDFIYDTFSREAIYNGHFDKFVQSDTYKKGTQTLDKDFVESLDSWRKYLATSIALENKKLNEEEINFVVQQTIDRLIFLRFCEDRGVEQYAQLQKAVSHGNSYDNLYDLFKRADDKYNSGLFDFKKDTISAKLSIKNKVLKEIIEDLYYPSPYVFRVMPVEVLGNAYEQFLGKIIRITSSHSARIEVKPEVRKAGGAYYTPQYIVEYIVKNTVGKLIEGKTPKEIEKIKIVDPACGSGSFLIGAFQYLVNYHVDWYQQHPSEAKKAKALVPPSLGEVRRGLGGLTTSEKKKILLNNIFGVDIDANAVEVTKLSLLLKCMEGETEASIKQQLSVFHERILPDLDNNIKSGNSLIDTDIYDSEMDLGYEKKIRPFSWKNAFPEVFKQGGFDTVIGNPPYVRQELLDKKQQKYFETKYKVYHGMADIYSYFFEKGIGLLNENGLFGIIVANKWMKANYGEPLRKWLKLQNIIELVDFGDLQVFEGATTYPCIIISEKGKVKKEIVITNIKTLDFPDLGKYVSQNKISIEQNSLDDNGWNLVSDIEQKLLQKINNIGVPLGQYVKGKIYRGVLTGLTEAFVIDEFTKNKLIKEDKHSAEVIKPFLAGRDIKRYQPCESDRYLIFFPKGFTNTKGKNPKNAWKWMQVNYPAIANHLIQFESKGKKRFDKGDYWWELRACDYYGEFEKQKIIYQVFQVSPCFIWDSNGHYCNNSIWIIPTDDKTLLAILNSPLGWYLISQYCTQIQNGYQLIYKYLEKVPIASTKKDTRNEIVKHVDLILKLNEEIKDENLQSKSDQIKQHIAHSEEKINELVYELYDLTPEEIKIVKGK